MAMPTVTAFRNSDNRLIYKKLGWKPNKTLKEGLIKTYYWIKDQII